MAANKDVAVIIFDIGENTLERESKESQTFFERAKDCIQKILLRKIFTKPKDEVSLLLIGTPTTDNDLNYELGGYEYISNGFPMAPTNWNMLNVVNSIEKPNEKITGDWLDAIIVAMHYLKTLSPAKSNLKIILFTTFSTAISDDNIVTITNGLLDMKIELMIISNNIEYRMDDDADCDYPVFSQTNAKNNLRKKGESLITDIVDQTNGSLCSFNEAIPQLVYFDKKQRRRVPWNCDLDIGTNLQIKIAAYIFIREDKEIGLWKARGPNGEQCKYKAEYYHNDELIDPDTLADQLIKGYMYGERCIPFEDTNTYEGGFKALRCIGFTDKAGIHDKYLAGTGVWAVVPQKDCTVAAKMLSSLVTVMRDTNLAMIARYTYGSRATPKIMALFPNNMNKKYPKHNSLLMYELFYKENFVQVSFPSLKTKKKEPTAEQYAAVEKLIDSMDLMNVDEGVDACTSDSQAKKSTEAFKKLLNPALQHLYRAMANRALNPKDPVLAADKDLLEMLNVPLQIQRQAKEHVDKVKELFKLEAVKKSSKTSLFEKLQKISLNNASIATDADAEAHQSIDLIEIGTVTPAEDFAELLNRGEPFTTLANQLKIVINSIVTKSVVVPEEKVAMAILVYREQAKLKSTTNYNEWIKEFKASLLQRGKSNLWEKLIQYEQLGLITAKESELSAVTDEQATEFYKLNGQDGNGNNSNGEDDEDDVENLFDDL